MTHICLVYDQLLWETDVNAYTDRIYAPLFPEEGILLNGEEMTLPDGWHTRSSGGAEISAVSIRREGNYVLENGSRKALMMLRVYEPDQLMNVLVLPKARFTVGRSHENEISCRDGFLSSSHGVFACDRQGVWTYQDLSTNGTFVNGKLLKNDRLTLKKGDRLNFPSLMEITVMDCALSVRYLMEQSRISLPAFHEFTEKCRVCLMVQTSGELHHMWIERTVQSVEEFLSLAFSRMNHADAAHLRRSCGLLNLKTGLPVTTKTDLVKMLSEDNAFVLVS